jgi:oxygen-independent coproporphyrinogen-3 oxidase
MAGLYIHIPFCHSKCIYCDFYSTPDLRHLDQLLDALGREYSRRRDEISEKFNTVYFGGGTPSIIPPEKLSRLCAALPVGNAEEFTIEANPEDIDPEKIKTWREIGINRISMGLQSFDDRELAIIRRRHSASDAGRAIETLLAGGIRNISCDLIYGLPGQSLGSWERSLDRLLAYDLPHISAYCLSYEPGTALYARMTAGRIKPTDDEILEEMYTLLCARTANCGYEHYEISNFAKPGMRSRHNSSYWTSTPYLGLGPGAHSFDGSTRRYNTTDLKTYVETADITVIDEENDDQRFNDLIITSLRTSDGLDCDRLDSDQRDYIIRAARPFVADGSVMTDGHRLRISEQAWFRSDAILREIII